MIDKKEEENNSDENTQFNDYTEDMDIMESVHDVIHRTNPGLSAIYKRFLPVEEEESEEASHPGFEDTVEDPAESEELEVDPVKKEKIPKKSKETKSAPTSSENKTEVDEQDKETKVIEAVRSIKGGMEASYNFQKQMRKTLGQDWQPKVLKILDELGTDEDHKKFERVAYQAVPKKDEK